MSSPLHIRLVDARRSADKAVSRLGDHERRPRAHDPTALPEDHLQAARILVRRELIGLVRRLDPVEMHNTAFDLRHRFLSDDDDVSFL